MKECNVQSLIQRVRIGLNESPSELISLTGNTDNIDLNDIIMDKLTDAVQIVHMNAPAGMIEGIPMNVVPHGYGNETSEGGTSERVGGDQDGSGYVILPDDFMRLVVFQMNGWKRPVTTPIADDHPDYILQKNRHVCGKIDKPVCALTTDDQGNKILEYYSVAPKVEHVIRKAIYLPWPEVKASSILVCRRLETAVVYRVIALVYLTLNDPARAEYYTNLSKSYMYDYNRPE